jgi:hypothetical protein
MVSGKKVLRNAGPAEPRAAPDVHSRARFWADSCGRRHHVLPGAFSPRGTTERSESKASGDEIIVMDDGSENDSVGIVRFVQQGNVALSAARNTGLRALGAK